MAWRFTATPVLRTGSARRALEHPRTRRRAQPDAGQPGRPAAHPARRRAPLDGARPRLARPRCGTGWRRAELTGADPVDRHIDRVLRVDEHRDRRAWLHPRNMHLRHDLVEYGAVGLRRPRAVTLNPALDPQYGRHVQVGPDLPDAVDCDGGGEACAIRQLRMPHHLQADLAGVGRLVNPVGDVADLAEERRRATLRLEVLLDGAVHPRPVLEWVGHLRVPVSSRGTCGTAACRPSTGPFAAPSRRAPLWCLKGSTLSAGRWRPCRPRR